MTQGGCNSDRSAFVMALSETPTGSDASECFLLVKQLRLRLKTDLTIAPLIYGRPRHTFNTLIIYGINQTDLRKSIVKIAVEIRNTTKAKRTILEFYEKENQDRLTERLLEKVELTP